MDTAQDWVFPVAWSVLYLSSAYAATRIAPMEGAAYGMAFWAMQIAFNTLWTPVFFGLHRIKAAFFIMIWLWTAVAGTMVSFFMLDWIAGALVRAVPDLGDDRRRAERQRLGAEPQRGGGRGGVNGARRKPHPKSSCVLNELPDNSPACVGRHSIALCDWRSCGRSSHYLPDATFRAFLASTRSSSDGGTTPRDVRHVVLLNCES
jgi:hypothetical protein